MTFTRLVSAIAAIMILVSATPIFAREIVGPGDGGGGDIADVRAGAAGIVSPIEQQVAESAEERAEKAAQKRREQYVTRTRYSLGMYSALLVHHLNVLIGVQYPIELPSGQFEPHSKEWLNQLQWTFARDTDKQGPAQLLGPGMYSYLKTATIEVSDDPLFVTDKNGNKKQVTFISYPGEYRVLVDGVRLEENRDLPSIMATFLHEFYVLNKIENSVEYPYSVPVAKALSELRSNRQYQQYLMEKSPILTKTCGEIYASTELKTNLLRAGESADVLLAVRVIHDGPALFQELARKAKACNAACSAYAGSLRCQRTK